MWLIEGIQGAERRGQRRHVFGKPGGCQMFLHCLRLVLNHIHQEWARQFDEIGEALGPRPQQIDQPIEPGIRGPRARTEQARARGGGKKWR